MSHYYSFEIFWPYDIKNNFYLLCHSPREAAKRRSGEAAPFWVERRGFLKRKSYHSRIPPTIGGIRGGYNRSYNQPTTAPPLGFTVKLILCEGRSPASLVASWWRGRIRTVYSRSKFHAAKSGVVHKY